MLEAAWLTLAVALLAYSNGANDNFKGVATLFGSGTTGYRTALGWATLTTLAGSCVALFLSGKLVKTFSGRGLAPDTVTRDSSFLLAVGVGAALTVLLATWRGWPVSTTHVSCGALFGLGAAIREANWTMIPGIILSWLLTLPAGAGFAAAVFLLLP